MASPIIFRLLNKTLLLAFITLSSSLFFVSDALASKVTTILAPHDAEYRLKMTERNTGSPLSGIDGKMSYFIDDTCDGWTVSQKFTLNYFYNNLKTVSEEKHFTNWEAKDGSSFQFASKNFSNGIIEEALRGTASKDENNVGKAIFSAPKDLSYDLTPKMVFPNQYVVNVLDRAKKGKKFYNMIWFDGSDTEGPIEVNTFIGEKIAPSLPKEILNDNIDTSLLGKDAWKIRLAFFPMSAEMSLPSHEMDVVLHDNGVVSSTIIHYKNFAITETLESLQNRKAPDC